MIRSIFLALALALVIGAPALAECPAAGPAATLYVPHFKLDPDGAARGLSALYAFQNASDSEVTVRVELYSVLGEYAGAYHVALAPGATATANMRDLVNGDGAYICPGHFYTLSPDHLRQVLGQPDGTLRGYVRAQVVTSCSLLSPGDPGYDALALDNPALIGDSFGLSVDDHWSRGELAVSALSAGPRRVRFLRFPGGGTDFVIFMPGAGAEAVSVPLVARNEAGEEVQPQINLIGGLRATASYEIGLDWIGLDGFGSLEFNCPLPCHVSAVMHADGYAVSVPAVPLSCP